MSPHQQPRQDETIRRRFQASPARRRGSALAGLGWLVLLGYLAVAWWPLELVHVLGLLLASLGITEYVLSSWRWRLELTSDELLVTPSIGTPRHVPREQVVGVREQTARPPAIVVREADDLTLPSGSHHHVDDLTALLGSMAPHDHTDVGRPPGPLRTVQGLLVAPNSTLRSFTHHPRVGLATAVLAAVSTLIGVRAATHWSRGEGFLAIEPAPTAQPPSMVAIVLGAALLGPVVHAVLVALLRLSARVLGGEGTFRRLYSGYAVAVLPTALVAIGGWVAMVGVFWALVNVVATLQESEHVSWWRATVILLLALPILPLVLAVAALLFGEPREGAAAALAPLARPTASSTTARSGASCQDRW
jgi:hypothetical protein